MLNLSSKSLFGLNAKVIGMACFAALLVSRVSASPIDYNATFTDQAKRLLAPVAMYGHVGAELAQLPPTLDSLLKAPSNVVSIARLQAYLDSKGLEAANLGGPLKPLPQPRYFVIHDTSSPYLGDAEFPADINEPTWSGNDLVRHLKVRVTHVYVNRVGESGMVYDFLSPVSGTKYGVNHPDERQNFVHIELIQPRRRDPAGGLKNDAIAPIPGFTAAQLERLALLYVTASARHGEWLVPGFHCPIDADYDAHDDPQNFDLMQWDTILGGLLGKIKALPIGTEPVHAG